MVDIINPTKPAMYPIGEPPWLRALPLAEGARIEDAFDQVMQNVAQLQHIMNEEQRTGIAQVPNLDGRSISQRPFTGEDIRNSSAHRLAFDSARIVWIYASVVLAGQAKKIEALQAEVRALQEAVAQNSTNWEKYLAATQAAGGAEIPR